MRLPRSPPRHRERACGPTRPLPAAATCSRMRRAFWSSIARASTRLNRIDEAVTIATLPAYKPVVEGEMIATVKIIPFAVAGDVFMQAMQTVADGEAAGAGRALHDPEGRRGLDAAAGSVAQGDRQDAEDHRGAAGARGRAHRRRAARAARSGRARGCDQGRAASRCGACHRVRRIRHCRPARRDPGRDRGGRRQASSISACRSIPAT